MADNRQPSKEDEAGNQLPPTPKPEGHGSTAAAPNPGEGTHTVQAKPSDADGATDVQRLKERTGAQPKVLKTAATRLVRESVKKGASSHNSWLPLGRDIIQWIREHTLAVAATAIFLVANIARWVFLAFRHIANSPNSLSVTLAQMLSGPSLTGRPGKQGLPPIMHIDLMKQFLHLLRSLVFVHGVIALVIYAVVLMVALSVAQTRLGTLKTIVVTLLSTLSGIILGLLICCAINMGLNDWHWMRGVPLALSPLTLVIGPLMAASAYEDVLWRRRIVLLGYSVVCAVLLFGGNPGSYCTLAAAVVGHLTGLIIHGKARDHVQWWQGTDYEIRRLFAAIQLVLAVGPILAMTSRSHAGILTNLALFTTPAFGDNSAISNCLDGHSTSSCTLLTGLHHFALAGVWVRAILPIAALAIVAWGLYRGRRLAAWVSIALNGATVVFAIIYYLLSPLLVALPIDTYGDQFGFSPAFVSTVIPPLLLVLLLLKNLPHFSIHTSSKRVVTGITAILGAAMVSSCGYLIFGLSLPQLFRPRATAPALLLNLLHLVMPTGFAGGRAAIKSVSPISSVVTQGFVVLFWIVVLMVFIFWFKDVVSVDERDRQRANLLVQAGGSSMSFMTTWEDNHYWFSPTGRSAIAYRIMHGVALTVTGPFGDPSEYMGDLREFIRFCNDHSWSPAFYAVHEDQRKELEKLGCSSIQVGTEMVVDPNSWQTRGKKWQDIRTAINKAKRDGFTDVLTSYDKAGWQVQQQIVDISEEWAQLKALPEMKFTLGGVEELRDPRVMLLYCQDEQGKVLGVTSWLPTYRDGRVVGWTLDFMRHRTDSPNGIMEFLIARMAERLRDMGQENPAQAVEFMSLSAAPLAGIGESEEERDSVGAQIIEHGLSIVADLLEPAYGFKSLFFFKKKFQPAPAPIYMSYPDSAKMAQIGLAVVGAYLPELKASQIAEMLKTLKPAKDGKVGNAAAAEQPSKNEKPAPGKKAGKPAQGEHDAKVGEDKQAPRHDKAEKDQKSPIDKNLGSRNNPADTADTNHS
ncbi:hypothetical protein CRD60_01250 [Bifidobacterium aemilianum]|uniref:Phosphatidylglycerol lysyltransferase C-terminal domain-containing protein n=1 Tax=Bifidobacterium aemilianum TaxID=2493120 RepID=A0A366KAA6_9BIFI|nr:phosphatidylglycerol lysyltransferase domain-containing protein [Bifidobacterium aemilianum]RBP98675.1 hypothetical protein CRD60_01250 [Bifidobacterium aemilianum]